MIRTMPAARSQFKLIVPLALVMFLAVASLAASEEVQNLTGLPVYPNLSKAMMDPTAKTDAFGRWCTRFSAETSYPIDIVEAWYRKALVGASETDLTHDRTYGNYIQLSGIKLALGVDYITVFKVTNQAPTSIELFKCSPQK
jgi:hypothetical protein